MSKVFERLILINFYDLMIEDMHKKMSNDLIRCRSASIEYQIYIIKYYNDNIEKLKSERLQQVDMLQFDEIKEQMIILRGNNSQNKLYQYAVERAYSTNSPVSIFKEKYPNGLII